MKLIRNHYNFLILQHEDGAFELWKRSPILASHMRLVNGQAYEFNCLYEEGTSIEQIESDILKAQNKYSDEEAEAYETLYSLSKEWA